MCVGIETSGGGFPAKQGSYTDIALQLVHICNLVSSSVAQPITELGIHLRLGQHYSYCILGNISAPSCTPSPKVLASARAGKLTAAGK